MSQEELARELAKLERREQAEISQPRISAYETGRNEMTLQVAVHIVTILNTRLEKIGLPTISPPDLLGVSVDNQSE